MTISYKCNCCAHENVCAKTESYKSACKKINDVTGAYEAGLVSVSIKCEHFMSKTATPKGMNTEGEK